MMDGFYKIGKSIKKGEKCRKMRQLSNLGRKKHELSKCHLNPKLWFDFIKKWLSFVDWDILCIP